MDRVSVLNILSAVLLLCDLGKVESTDLQDNQG
jgi:hypothetical protein